MAKNKQPADEQAQELRDIIRQRGWKATADLVIHVLEFVAELCDTTNLSVPELQGFLQSAQIWINTLWEVGDGSHKQEIDRIRLAVERLNRANASCRDLPLEHDGWERWSVYKAQAWCEYLNEMHHFFRVCCDSWRSILRTFDRQHRERALKCIDEIEKRIPVLHSARLADVLAQRAAIEQIVLLNAKLTVYAGHSEPLQRCSNSLTPGRSELDSFQRSAAFCLAVLGDDLVGQKEWLDQNDSLQWVQAETNRLASIYDNDGRRDSNGRTIHETAYIDPLYKNDGDFLAPGVVDKVSLAAAEHPDIRMEVEDPERALKMAGLNDRERKALLMRLNGDIMSHKDLKEWKRTQRAISRHRSALVRAISAATKKRVIKAPLISGGSCSGVIREGGSYTLPLPDDQKPTQSVPAPNPEAKRWFDDAPPPISRSHGKTKHLFKKVST
jgi:hypothetical protein